MATNIKRYLQQHFALPVVVSHPTTPVSGDPVRYGELTGIALTDEGEGGNGATYTTVEFGACVADVSVKAVDGSGNSAVAVGDTIYYVDADTPVLSKKASGYFFGFALETITSGSTDTINVLKLPAGSNISTVGTSDISAGAVTAAKLSTTLKTGFIPLSLANAREVATNAIQNAAANGGSLASDTTPILQRVNGATDKAIRINWAASNSDEITWEFPYPPDLDDAANVEVHILAAMAGATDTPTVAIGYFEATGDSNAGGNTAAITGTTVAEYSVAITAANIGTAPNFASISVTPGTHTTDALYIYAVWVEYTRA